MRNLIVDVGNTRVKLAEFEQDKMVSYKVTSLDSFHTEFSSFVNLYKYIMISSVVSLQIDTKHSHVFILNEQTPIPIQNEYKTPHTLGRDRLANVIGAYAMADDNNGILIVDLGTCLKFDFIHQSKYKGGAISNGLLMRFKALHDYTDKLPLIDPEKVNYLMGKDTKESILSGVINGMKAEINGVIEQYQNKYPNFKVFLTGGDAHFFEKEIKNNIFVNEYLTLIGLNEILKFNVE